MTDRFVSTDSGDSDPNTNKKNERATGGGKIKNGQKE